jgi:hypothetical protein
VRAERRSCVIWISTAGRVLNRKAQERLAMLSIVLNAVGFAMGVAGLELWLGKGEESTGGGERVGVV